ncbi:DUF3813 domain-containing protein [Rossellomorea aquimaris]|uniref:DUF3813 domain-containing protein n=1 Tax=Rossellomorea aquimaris TaxID=189382 RepID=UPI001CD635C1|nr:DUF3813 domain-containing protein [Rossellomorea aquimaris]MCA1056763.1 DUF3813 domain-containing protein [Rossellomorea aquimaris]
MSNSLFRQARQAVNEAKQANAAGGDPAASVTKAKNALSSAYANSNVAEQSQLHALQDELNTLQ